MELAVRLAVVVVGVALAIGAYVLVQHGAWFLAAAVALGAMISLAYVLAPKKRS